MFEESEGDDECTGEVDKVGDVGGEREELIDVVFKIDWLE